MKVLVDNYNKESHIDNANTYPRNLVCEKCGSELEYNKEDVRIGVFGVAYLDCPLCNHENMTDDGDGIDLTVNNVEFPTHFHYTSKDKGAVDCCNNEEVRKCIKKAIEYFRENKEEFYWFTEHGNLHVDVTRWTGDETYCVHVTNNYYTTYIPFESVDY